MFLKADAELTYIWMEKTPSYMYDINDTVWLVTSDRWQFSLYIIMFTTDLTDILSSSLHNLVKEYKWKL